MYLQLTESRILILQTIRVSIAIMKLIYMMSVLLTAILIGGFMYRSSGNKEAIKLDVVRQEEISDIPYDDRCPDQFVEYKTEQFSICHPFELQLTESTSSGLLVTFSSQEEELMVGYDPDKKWQIHLCNFEKKVTIASQSASRTAFNQESVAGCGRPYRFVTTLEFENELFSIDLRKRMGTYGDTKRYDMIEQSLQLPAVP